MFKTQKILESIQAKISRAAAVDETGGEETYVLVDGVYREVGRVCLNEDLHVVLTLKPERGK